MKVNHPLLILLVHIFLHSATPPYVAAIFPVRIPWSSAPVVGLSSHNPPLPSCLPPHWQSSHIQNNPRAVIAINQKQNKTKNVYLVGNSSPSEYSLEQGVRGEKQAKKKVTEWALDIHLKKKKINWKLHIFYFSLCLSLASLTLWVKNNRRSTFGCRQLNLSAW